MLSSRGHGCFPAGLEEGERLRQSALVPNRMCPQQDTNTGSSSDLGSSSVERSSLVPSSSGYAERLSTSHSSTGISGAEGGSSKDTRNNPLVSRVACLRERY